MRAVSFTTLIQSSPTSPSTAAASTAAPSKPNKPNKSRHASRRYPGQRRPNILLKSASARSSPSSSDVPSSASVAAAAAAANTTPSSHHHHHHPYPPHHHHHTHHLHHQYQSQQQQQPPQHNTTHYYNKHLHSGTHAPYHRHHHTRSSSPFSSSSVTTSTTSAALKGHSSHHTQQHLTSADAEDDNSPTLHPPSHNVRLSSASTANTHNTAATTTLNLTTNSAATMTTSSNPSATAASAAVPVVNAASAAGAGKGTITTTNPAGPATTAAAAPGAGVVTTSTASTASTNLGPAIGGGRDSLVADLFWTFHGENAQKYADVTLISSDGRTFPCCRGILAARSEYFARLLFASTTPGGHPTPSSTPSTTVRIDMPGHVLAMIVQYLHTGDIASEDCHDRDALDRLLDVARAAHSMNHSALFADCVRHLLDIVDQNQAMLCPVFEAFFGDASVVDGSSLLTPLLQHVRSNPMACLLLPDLGSDFSVHPYHALSIAGKVNMGAVTNAYLAAVDDLRPPVATGSGVAEPVGVLELSGRALETLIAEDKKKKKVMLSAAAASAAKGGGPNAAAAASLAASLSAATAAALSGDKRGEGMIIHEEFWFYVVWYWALHNPHMNSLPSSHDGTTDLDNTGVHGNNIKELSIEAIARRTHATQIIDLLDSRRMRAAFLLRVVEPTALMSLSKLCEGYKAHATHSLTTGHSKSSMSANVNMSHSVNAAAEWTRKRLRFRQRGVKT